MYIVLRTIFSAQTVFGTWTEIFFGGKKGQKQKLELIFDFNIYR